MATVIVYEVDSIGLLPAVYDVRAAKQLFLRQVELTCRRIGKSQADQ